MTTKDLLIRHATICFLIFLAFTVMTIFAPNIHLGFFGTLAFLLIGSAFTTAGVSIGDAFRRFVMPDFYLASDAVDSFKKKIFWAIGPQAIGWFIGLMATRGFMNNILGFRNLL